MATIALSTVGAAFGGSIIPQFGIGSFLGAQAGILLGGAIDRFIFGDIYNTAKHGYRLSDLSVQTSTYGKVIPKVYGTVRIAGNIIWSMPLKERSEEHNDTYSTSKSGPKTISKYSTYSYYVTLALAICCGEIDNILRIWADGNVLDKSTLKYRIYKGSETQEPDHLILSVEGDAPAYRGMAYIVIEDFPLSNYGNRIPNFNFEVQRNLKPELNKKIKGINIIPGSGEFVYDTVVQHKMKLAHGVRSGFQDRINQNTDYDVADSLVALEDLQNTLPEVKWISLVVNWFINSVNLNENILIYPAVEFKDSITIPDDWKVAGMTRNSAHCITLDDNFQPIYGGTISDDALVRYVLELKSKGYKILLYPMLLVDDIKKPWRGRITGKVENLSAFFNQYSYFVEHYANLLKDKIDAFVLGSEFKGITSLYSVSKNIKAEDFQGEENALLEKKVFDGVEKFVLLAKKIKSILKSGKSNVLLTYAADWSEYHSCDGEYNMDSLWSSEHIDFIGIDAYFPLTDSRQPIMGFSKQEIIDGWDSGEGYDYFYKDPENRSEKTYFEDKRWSWKNMRKWWSENHYRSDGSKTNWQAKMKPIWFVEYGFPSVDCCSNQPNVFLDKTSTESRLPYHSSGSIDIKAQITAIEATIDRWEGSDMVKNMFLWAWDARPFPYFPDLQDVWADGNSWQTGHWVQGKLSSCSLSSVVKDILLGIKFNNFDSSELLDLVDGYVVYDQSSAKKAIEILQEVYYFDTVEQNGNLKFQSRKFGRSREINSEDLSSLEISRDSSVDIPKECNIVYMDKFSDYRMCTATAVRAENSGDTINLSVPLVLSNSAAKRLSEIKLYESCDFSKTYSFKLPYSYAYLKPSDIVVINEGFGLTHRVKIKKIRHGKLVEIFGVSIDNELYSFNPTFDIKTNLAYKASFPGKTECQILDINLGSKIPSLYIVANGLENAWKGASIFISEDDGNNYKKVANVYENAIRGTSLYEFTEYNTCLFDFVNSITVVIYSGTLESIEKISLYNGVNAALIGEEIIQFLYAELIQDNVYKLSGLLRGRMGTKAYDHKAKEDFILLDYRILKLDIAESLIGRQMLYKAISFNEAGEPDVFKFRYKANGLKPLAPVHGVIKKHSNGDFILSWIRCSRQRADWPDYADLPNDEVYEKYEIDFVSDGRVLATFNTEISELTITTSEQIKHFKFNISELKVSCYFEVYQMSVLVGRGHPCVINV